MMAIPDLAVAYPTYRMLVFSVAFAMLRTQDEAEDAVAETFIRALAFLPNLDPDRPLNVPGWLTQICRNYCRDRLRHWRRYQHFPLSPDRHEHLRIVHRSESPEPAFAMWQTTAEVEDVLDLMGHDRAVALALRMLHGFDLPQIAEALGTTRSAVKSILWRARIEFRSIYLQRHGGVR
jgi:RNA polymerase sigma-70 factor, ECF subfamily